MSLHRPQERVCDVGLADGKADREVDPEIVWIDGSSYSDVVKGLKRSFPTVEAPGHSLYHLHLTFIATTADPPCSLGVLVLKEDDRIGSREIANIRAVLANEFRDRPFDLKLFRFRQSKPPWYRRHARTVVTSAGALAAFISPFVVLVMNSQTVLERHRGGTVSFQGPSTGAPAPPPRPEAPHSAASIVRATVPPSTSEGERAGPVVREPSPPPAGVGRPDDVEALLGRHFADRVKANPAIARIYGAVRFVIMPGLTYGQPDRGVWRCRFEARVTDGHGDDIVFPQVFEQLVSGDRNAACESAVDDVVRRVADKTDE